jgi:hypothetical protein
MLAKPKDQQQTSFFSTFEEQLNHRQQQRLTGISF